MFKFAEELVNDVLQKRINDLKDLVKTQCSDGNWNYDPYMHGMANGMILSLNLMGDTMSNPYSGVEMKYPFLDAPEQWISKKASSNGKLIVAVDFDGTIAYKTENLEPQELLPCAKEVMNWMYDSGKIHVIIWTCRTGPELRKAIDFLNGKGVKYHDVNSNSEDLDFQTSNKIYADIYIDDRMLGNEEIDWMKIKQMIEQKICEQTAPKVEVNVEELIKQIVFAKVSGLNDKYRHTFNLQEKTLLKRLHGERYVRANEVENNVADPLLNSGLIAVFPLGPKSYELTKQGEKRAIELFGPIKEFGSKNSYSLTAPEQKYQVRCRKCHQVFDLPITKKQVDDWHSGTLIQRAFPNLKPDQRELLMSGLCGKCWDKQFKASASTKELYLQYKAKAEAMFKKFLLEVERKKFKTISLPKFPKPLRYLDSGEIYGIGIIFNSRDCFSSETKELKNIAKKYGLKYEDLDETRTEIYFNIPRKAQWKSGPAKEGF